MEKVEEIEMKGRRKETMRFVGLRERDGRIVVTWALVDLKLLHTFITFGR